MKTAASSSQVSRIPNRIQRTGPIQKAKNVATNNRLAQMAAETIKESISEAQQQQTARPVLQTRSKTVLDVRAKPTIVKPVARPAAAAAAVAKPAATTTKPTTTTAKVSTSKTTNGSSAINGAAGAAAKKPVAKRIPAYDYKARFNDLLEKHKALKERFEEQSEQLLTFDSLPEHYEACKKELAATKATLEELRVEHKAAKGEIAAHEKKSSALTASLIETKEQLELKTDEAARLAAENASMISELTELRQLKAVLTEKVSELSQEVELSRDQLFRVNIERKELHNVVMDLRGNIRVFCRIRPPLEEERDRETCTWNYLDECSLEVAHFDQRANKLNKHDFSFDHVFHPRCRQEDIFEMVTPLIQSALDGFNVCIFAYGQTGSGKTYTMDGAGAEKGVIPRTVDLLFGAVQDYRRLGWSYEIRASFLEIYNEVLYDLLSNDAKELDIRMVSATNKTDVYVSNLTEEVVERPGQLQQLIHRAKTNRMTASTCNNERSSRSHAVTRIQLIGRHEAKGEQCVGNINLVDLAGSESPKTSTRMDETKAINKSLSELSNVILALVQRNDHVPYRNSKLTHLLMPSLGGNSKTLMFVNVAPFGDCYVETVKSLRFAATVNSCKMAKAKKNRVLTAA